MIYCYYGKEEPPLLCSQDQLRYFLASVVTCKATQHSLGRFDEEPGMQPRWSDLSAPTRTPCLHPPGRRTSMETRFYQTPEITIPPIAQALELEYLAQGYEAQHFGDVNQTTVQLKKESALRAITGFDKALTISFQRVNGGVFVTVGAQDWVDQLAVGAVGLFIHPLLITAAVGAMQQRNALHDVLTSIDQHIRYQQPQAQVGEPPTPLAQREMTGSSA